MKVKVLLSRPFVGCREGTRRRTAQKAGRDRCLFWGMFFFVFGIPLGKSGRSGQKKVKKKVVLPLMTIVLGDAYFNPSVLRTSQSDA